jgi:CubicO group peptidase (beta-lactamase class C family)
VTNLFKRSSALMVTVLLLVSTSRSQDLGKSLDDYLQAAASQQRFSGTVLIARDGSLLLDKGYGKANLELDVANTPKIKFRLGSITKQFTATAILLLQEKGQLTVDDAVCKYISSCPAAWSDIKIHHLLTHTSGIYNFTKSPDYTKSMMLRATPESIVARVKDLPLDFKPGEKFSYSNSGYILLGMVIEKVSGKTYAQYLGENIFKPLKMADTGYDSTSRIIPDRAEGYSKSEGKLANAEYLDMSIPFAAGALYSTVGDLYIWAEALNSDRILSKKSKEQMFTPFKQNYAYGWGVDSLFNHKRTAHGGGINGFATFIERFPDDHLTVIVLSNFDFADTGRIARDLAAMALGEKVEPPRDQPGSQVR